MTFIHSCSNMRERAYSIPIADFVLSKKIAGKIQPAMITTTAIASGLATLELYKVVQRIKDLKKYSSYQICIANNSHMNLAPISIEQGSNLWRREKISLGKDSTLQDIVQIIYRNIGQVVIIKHNSKTIFVEGITKTTLETK